MRDCSGPCLQIELPVLRYRLPGRIDERVADLFRRPRDARALDDGEMLQLDFAVFALPSRRRREFFKIFDGFDGAFLQRLGVLICAQCVVELQLVVTDIEDLVNLGDKLVSHIREIGGDFLADCFLCRGNTTCLWIECFLVVVEESLDGSRIAQIPQFQNALHFVETCVVVENGVVAETLFEDASAGIRKGKVVLDVQKTAVPFKRMARVDGEEFAVDDAFVLAVGADGVAVRQSEENGLVFAERLHLDVRLDAAVLDESFFKILVSMMLIALTEISG